MHYPWWYVPYLTAPMLIALVAVVHVLVSHYAVGGGLFLAWETRFAYRKHNRGYLAYLRRHARFFVLLTVVFGAITGVGIWWTIGLASPLATEVLIRTFVFGWAMEWVFFVIEITSAFIFFYWWGRLPERTHVRIGMIYGAAAWISLVLITGITAFMLNPGDWPARGGFWVGFFNPQFVPQVVARTGGALLLTSLYVYLHASLTIKDAELRELISRRSLRPSFVGVVLIAAGGAGWYAFLPPSAMAVLPTASVLNVLMAAVVAMTVVVFAAIWFGPYRNPSWLSPGFAAMMLLFGFGAVTTGEFIREAVRKPYVVYNVVLGNQILPEEIPRLRQSGILAGGTWTRALVVERHPGLIVDGRLDAGRLAALGHDERLALGEVLFQYQCNDCHAARDGYSAVAPLVRGRSPGAIQQMIVGFEKTHFYMPPWCGTEEEALLLGEYLAAIAPPKPKGMRLDGQEEDR
ncbi:MAG TPA: cytochrome ubiquinol oxidase subunit I [Thermoguttaceae bacterium]|nr:cytochrome ubiquinol oxidase subunit I [Thermoguttaceae bacterium]